MVDINTFFAENLVPSGFAVQRAKDRLHSMRRGELGFISGMPQLDITFRLMPGELTTIGGRAGTGKTAFGLQMVYAVLAQLKNREQPGCVAVFSAEMDGETLMLREACALERIPLWQLQTGKCTDMEADRIDRRLDSLDNSRLLIDQSPAPTIEHMIDQLAAVSEERMPIRFVLFDYTELAGEFDRVESQRIAKISRGMKAIAKRYACPVLTLSQLNRDIEGRSDKTPSMRDLMHGGEREPDRIVILVRPWLYDKAQPSELINAYTVKNRNGPLGEAQLFYEQETMRFQSAVVKRHNMN